jgi:hypothetical protein
MTGVSVDINNAAGLDEHIIVAVLMTERKSVMKLPANHMVKRFAGPVPFLLLGIIGTIVVLPRSEAEGPNATHHTASKLSDPIHGQPLAFERYEDQFVSRTPGYTVFLEPRQATIALRSGAAQANTKQPSFTNGGTRSFIRMRLLQSNPASTPLPEDPLLAKANYFIGNDPAKWRTNVPLFSRVRFPSVYKDVDLLYYGSQQHLEYDFVIRPGGEPQSISFAVDGASSATVVQSGDLVLQTGSARAVLHRPIAYQIVNAQRHDVTASFLPLGGSSFGIRVARYDHKAPMIIDPVLAYSTYLGGSDDEGIFGIGFDDDGNIYVAGETSSLDFPQKGGIQNRLGGNYDAFVSKFDPQGANLIYSTYLGGANYDHAIGIQVDEYGSVYLAGVTQSPDFPVEHARQPALAGAANGFVAKLSPSGSELVFSTYLGGQGFDQISALAIDHDNAIYVAGSTNSLDFPITSNAFQKQCDGGSHQGFCIGDAFAAKFDPSGQKLIYSTYLGGAGYDLAAGISVNEHGEAYIAGQTGSSDFPTKNPYQRSLLGPNNAFISKLNVAGSGLMFSTFLGGTGFDRATDIALGHRGNIYVTGTATSLDFPLARAFQTTNKSGFTGFVTKFNPQASQLVYSTYYGGSGSDYPFRIAVNRHGEAALIGITSSTDFPTYRALNPSYSGGATDAFVVLLDRSGQQPLFSTYLGGTGNDYGYAVSVGCRDSVWIGGSTSSRDFPLTQAFQPVYAGGPFDAFLSRILNHDDQEEAEEVARSLHSNDGHERGCRQKD